jgi:hypothetical protein
VTADLEQRLRDLGAELEVPPTPPLAAAVRARLGEAPDRRLTRFLPPPWWRRRVAVAAMAVALALLLVLAIPPARTTVAHWLGLRGVEIVPVQTLPPIPTRTPHASTSPSAPGELLGLGVVVPLDKVPARVGFTPVVPAALGAPDAVWVRDDNGGVVTLVYLARPGLPASGQTGLGLLVTELRASIDTRVMGKFIDASTPLLPVSVGGGQGFWIGGAPHAVGYQLPGGNLAIDDLRLAGPTLLFERGDLTVRIEGPGDEQTALGIATTLR